MNEQAIPSRFQGILIRSYGERNMYHDSYWDVLIWDVETGRPRIECAATTACGGGDMWFCPRGLTDLSPENALLYKEWARRQEVQRRWDERRNAIWGARETCLTRAEYKRLRNLENVRYVNDEKAREGVELLEALLKTKNFRSAYRKSLADQVRAWLKQENPTFKTPLSPKQMASLSANSFPRRRYA